LPARVNEPGTREITGSRGGGEDKTSRRPKKKIGASPLKNERAKPKSGVRAWRKENETRTKKGAGSDAWFELGTRL